MINDGLLNFRSGWPKLTCTDLGTQDSAIQFHAHKSPTHCRCGQAPPQLINHWLLPPSTLTSASPRGYSQHSQLWVYATLEQHLDLQRNFLCPLVCTKQLVMQLSSSSRVEHSTKMNTAPVPQVITNKLLLESSSSKSVSDTFISSAA